ncbi:hypothetical protein PPL_06308 [Heterostelium album PN500]|uniref:Uncharacterized protein n=1 Tax=Heterostelium pallidum (strain ATCC 26659 / Pp 5 / PN500) TaxID=670386 RepID=D3BCT0_HETP5|nr:hypothetical protein PPL_06308 [Heterostelium album PN500]EFA80722.1 hypothetical protein PPL_06308 [Heterostelium album PN500]|eukprot:XP_020432842.1 hypothetical protein PPL_06308 [Heterostelium album PN500]
MNNNEFIKSMEIFDSNVREELRHKIYNMGTIHDMRREICKQCISKISLDTYLEKEALEISNNYKNTTTETQTAITETTTRSVFDDITVVL